MKKFFGMAHGQQASLYVLENDTLSMAVTDYGATLVSLVDKKTGIDVVQGYESAEEYVAQDVYTGATIGRTANRIEKGEFSLNGTIYHLPINNNGNCNHGGISGFNDKMYSAREYGDRVEFNRISLDGEEGYPGNLWLTVTYKLLKNGVEVQADAHCDKDTLFSFTNHSYFNLDQSENVLDHEVRLMSHRFALSDANGLALPVFKEVADTPFDFRSFKKLGRDIGQDDEQLRFGKGYDHYFAVDGEGMRLMAQCQGKQLCLFVYSDLPGFHLYTGNWLRGLSGKHGMRYPAYSAVCFEASYMPNAINYPDIEPKPILRKDTSVSCRIKWILQAK